MLVTVEIDISRDIALMERTKNDPKLFAMLSMYDEDTDESYLIELGQQIWNTSDYPTRIKQYCEGSIFDFCQPEAFLFKFGTDETSAVLFRTGCPTGASSRIIYPQLTPEVTFSITDEDDL